MTGVLDFIQYESICSTLLQHMTLSLRATVCVSSPRSSPPLHVPPRTLERARASGWMTTSWLAALEKLGLGPNVLGPQGPACHRVDIVSACQCCIRCVRLIHDLACPRPEAAKGTSRRSGQRCQKLQPRLQLGPRLQPRWLGPRLQPRWLGPRLQSKWLGHEVAQIWRATKELRLLQRPRRGARNRS